EGGIDDVRIYPRSLSAPEIRALFLSGWQPASLAESGPDVASTGWHVQTPKWLEGSYRIEARGWDSDGHTSPPRSTAQTWSGEADTLAPRVSLVRSPSGNGFRYTTTAEDYNLTGEGLVTPCPGRTTTVSTNFQSPWYVAAYPASPRLYRLVADCVLPTQAANETATACDTFGNCATVDVTVAASAGLPAEVEAALSESSDTIESEALGGDGAVAFMRPALAFFPSVLTTTHLYPPAVVDVTGLVTGTRVIKDVAVSVGGASGQAILAAATRKAMTTTWRFPWPLGQNTLPDGVQYTAVATGTRATGGKPVVEKAQLLVDVAPPGAVELALQSGTSPSGGGGQPLAPGDTVRTAVPELVLTWQAASDGSGVAGYEARWHAESGGVTTLSARSVGPDELLEDRYNAGEAQKLTVDLASRDRYGNVRWQKVAPVYADSPLTPDYIALGKDPYEGWQESGCTLLGTDRRMERQLLGGRPAQRLYATWDRAALRLAWTGASWSIDGDLFVYLDTMPGGTDSLYDPGGAAAGGVQTSNQAMEADYLVWVQDAHTATLLRWDGGAWVAEAELSEELYRFDPGREGGQTDLYLPFDLMGLTSASSLGLLAIAGEERSMGQGLQWWATLPQFNPVNSSRVNRMLSFAPADAELMFTQAYRWPALGDGVCPNGSDDSQPGARFGDVDPQITIESDPPGVGLSGLGRRLFWVSPAVLSGAAGPEQAGLHFADPAHPPLDAGQTIHYTVRYRNDGTEPHQGVWLALTGHGVELSSSVLDLGDVPPGTEAAATFQAKVTESGFEGARSAVTALIYDAAHPAGDPLEWLWSAHQVDQGPPEAVSITSLGPTVGPGKASLAGFAHDESGVRSVEVEIQGPNETETITCLVERPAEGRWGCPWDFDGAADGATFSLRVRATDTLGHTSDWSSPQTVRVDARPPVLQMSSPLRTDVMRGGENLFGSALDDSGIAGVRICVDEECER
ncbi:MAG: hypothetical protein ACK2U9_13780, partial [Anaerolineae bacterium]